jgi:hypothetical protein
VGAEGGSVGLIARGPLEAAHWGDDGETIGRHAGPRWTPPAVSCRRLIQIHARAGTDTPKVTDAVLMGKSGMRLPLYRLAERGGAGRRIGHAQCRASRVRHVGGERSFSGYRPIRGGVLARCGC